MNLRDALAHPPAEMQNAPPHLQGSRLACAEQDGKTYTAYQKTDGSIILKATWAEPGNWLKTTVTEDYLGDCDPPLSWRPGWGLMRTAAERTARCIEGHGGWLGPEAEQKLRLALTDSEGDLHALLDESG